MNYYFWVLFFLILSTNAWAQNRTRGVDFRMQLVSGTLDFTSISDVQRKFNGLGSELSTHDYLYEKGRWRSTGFISSRVMSFVGQEVQEGETDDLQIFTIAPGLEFGYGPFYIQAAYQMMNVNAYYISSASLGKRFTLNGMSYSAGMNFRFGHLGLGLGAAQVNLPVSPEKMGITNASVYKELSYSFNLIYYIGVPPRKFFSELFR